MITDELVQALAYHKSISMTDAKTQLKQMLAAEEAKWMESARLAIKEAEIKRLDQYVLAVTAAGGLTNSTDIVQRAYTQMQATDRFVKEHA